MSNLHPIFQQALAPFAPPSLNDDDFYIVDLKKRAAVSQFDCASVSAQVARTQGIPVLPGQALLTGMQARMLGVLAPPPDQNAGGLHRS